MSAGVMPGSILVRSFCLNSLKIWTSWAALILISFCYKYLVVTVYGAMNPVCVCVCVCVCECVCVCVCLLCRSRWFVDRVSRLRVVQTNCWFLPCGRSNAVARSGTLSKLGGDFIWAFWTSFARRATFDNGHSVLYLAVGSLSYVCSREGLDLHVHVQRSSMARVYGRDTPSFLTVNIPNAGNWTIKFGITYTERRGSGNQFRMMWNSKCLLISTSYLFGKVL